jgi:hypothetical protein
MEKMSWPSVAKSTMAFYETLTGFANTHRPAPRPLPTVPAIDPIEKQPIENRRRSA